MFVVIRIQGTFDFKYGEKESKKLRKNRFSSVFIK